MNEVVKYTKLNCGLVVVLTKFDDVSGVGFLNRNSAEIGMKLLTILRCTRPSHSPSVFGIFRANSSRSFFAPLFVLAMLSGCITNSSHLMRESLTHSVALELNSSLYAPELLGEPVRVAESNQRIDSFVKAIMEEILATYSERSSSIQNHSQERLWPLPRVKVEVTDTGKPNVYADIDGIIVVDRSFVVSAWDRAVADRHLELFYNIMLHPNLLRDVFLAARTLKFSDFPQFEAANDRVQKGLSLTLLERAQRLAMIHDLALSSSDDTWAKTFRDSEVDPVTSVLLVAELDRMLAMSVRFALAHELGHLALGHVYFPARELSCNALIARELEADQFGAMLASFDYNHRRVNFGFGSLPVFSMNQSVPDSAILLESAYPRNVRKLPAFGRSCEYPEEQARIMAVDRFSDPDRSGFMQSTAQTITQSVSRSAAEAREREFQQTVDSTGNRLLGAYRGILAGALQLMFSSLMGSIMNIVMVVDTVVDARDEILLELRKWILAADSRLQ